MESGELKTNILGTDYTIRYVPEESTEKLKDCNGYCEPYSKEIIVGAIEPDPMNVNDVHKFEEKVLKHEIIHAYLHESGLSNNSEWATNEEVVDWIALQIDKIYNTVRSVSSKRMAGEYDENRRVD